MMGSNTSRGASASAALAAQVIDDQRRDLIASGAGGETGTATLWLIS